MRRNYNYRLPLLLALMVVFGMFVGFKFQGTYNLNEGANPKKKIEEVLRYIESAYVDEPDREKIAEAAVEAMLHELDPHSVYIPARDLKATNEELEGNFDGIGVEFNIHNDTIIVVTPLSGGPSEQLGIRPGDRIIEIEGKVVAGVGFTNEDVVKNLRGPKGTKVTVKIKRVGDPKPFDVTITRDKIPIYSVDASYMANPNTGYIKINRFGATTLREYNDAFRQLSQQGMKNLILDLRGNPGGYLNAAIKLSDEYLKRGQLIVYTEGRSRPKDVATATAIGGFEDGKLIVLIDEGSASASEIVSGAVQDHDRGLVIGRRSFGKGLVQEPFMLTDGSAIRLTVARYYTPSGRSIQRSYEKGVDAYYEDLTHRFDAGEMLSKDSIKFADSLKFFTTNKRIVYGGGGIMPDIFVPLDTSTNSEYVQKLFSKGAFNEFVVDYVDRNRKTITAERFKDFETFDKEFIVDAKMLNEFIKFGEGKGVKRDAKGLVQSETLIKSQLKALIARQFFRNDGFFRVINGNNNTYQKALQVLEDGTYEKMNLKQ